MDARPEQNKCSRAFIMFLNLVNVAENPLYLQEGNLGSLLITGQDFNNHGNKTVYKVTVLVSKKYQYSN